MYYLFALIALFGFIGVFYPTPWHRKIKITNARWKNLGVLVVASLIAGSLAPETPANTTVVADTKTEEQPKVPAEKVYKIGDTVGVSNRSFKVNSVQEMDDIKDPLGIVHPAGEGARFIKINVTVKNQKKEQTTIALNDVKLMSSNGSEYSSDPSNEVWVNELGQSLFFATLNPGVSKTTNVLFAVPKDIKLADLKVKVTDGGMVEDVVKHIQLSK
jgi:hypothetical protein